jgi:transposase
MIRIHLEGIVALAQIRQTNGFLETFNSVFQASRRRAQRFTRIPTIRTLSSWAGKLDSHAINPHAGNPLEIQ